MASAVIQSGVPATVQLVNAGQALIAANQSAVDVADSRITSSAVVVVSLLNDNGAAASPTQPGCSVCLNPGTGFTIRTTAPATNPGTGLVCNYAILRF